MFHPGGTYSLDMDSGGLKYHSQFFVCKSGLFFFMGSIITSPNADTCNYSHFYLQNLSSYGVYRGQQCDIMGKHISDGFLLLFCKTDCFFGQSKHKQSLIHPKFEHFR